MVNWSGTSKLSKKVLKRYAEKIVDASLPVVDAELVDYFWFPTVAFGKLMKAGAVNPVKALNRSARTSDGTPCRAFGGPCSGYEWAFWHYQLQRLRSHHGLHIRTYDQFNFTLMPTGTGASRTHMIARRHTCSEDIEEQKTDPRYVSMELTVVNPNDQHMLADLTKIDFKTMQPMTPGYYDSMYY